MSNNENIKPKIQHEIVTSILDNMEFAIVGVDINGTVFYANERYGLHIGKPLSSIVGKRLQDVYVGSTTITALKAGRKVVVEKKVCPVDNTKYVTGIATPIYSNNKLAGAFSLYMDLPADSIKLEDATETFFTNYVRQKLFDSAEELGKYNIVGQSASFLQIIEKASLIAETDVPVMLRGENGVGKDIIAKFIHQKSRRKDKPYVVVNCAAIPENLVESELFGYVSGSFTGAKVGGKIGKFEMANGGTLFLDEIGDMPILMQAKLLRAIQDNEIEKIGSEKSVSVDVRIITATNQNLEEMITEKAFREDLYYRINSFSLNLPPLRERKDDITLFLDYFLNLYNTKYNKKIRLSTGAVAKLTEYNWPGNIRELKNRIENIVVLSEEELCTSSMVSAFFDQPLESHDNIIIKEEPNAKLLSQVVADAEKNAIIDALRISKNNKTEAMNLLGLSRKTFYRKMNEYGLL